MAGDDRLMTRDSFPHDVTATFDPRTPVLKSIDHHSKLVHFHALLNSTVSPAAAS